MNFKSGFPWKVNNWDTIWVIVDRLTKPAHFIPIQLNYPLERLVELYIEKIVSLHGITSNIVSDMDLRFTSRFWESLQKNFGYKTTFEFYLSPADS